VNGAGHEGDLVVAVHLEKQIGVGEGEA